MSAPLLFLISALRNLLRNTRRTLAVLATVACGTGILYVYHGFNTGIMNPVTLVAAILAGMRVARMPIAEALRAS